MMQPIEPSPRSRWNWLFESNFFGHYEIVQKFLPLLRLDPIQYTFTYNLSESAKRNQKAQPRIVFTGSLTALFPVQQDAACVYFSYLMCFHFRFNMSRWMHKSCSSIFFSSFEVGNETGKKKKKKKLGHKIKKLKFGIYVSHINLGSLRTEIFGKFTDGLFHEVSAEMDPATRDLYPSIPPAAGKKIFFFW
jgi:hypothetical protein